MKSTERVIAYRERQALLKRNAVVKREMYLTDAEFKEIKGKLAELRKSAT